jgi:hypothetical protein
MGAGRQVANRSRQLFASAALCCVVLAALAALFSRSDEGGRALVLEGVRSYWGPRTPAWWSSFPVAPNAGGAAGAQNKPAAATQLNAVPRADGTSPAASRKALAQQRLQAKAKVGRGQNQNSPTWVEGRIAAPPGPPRPPGKPVLYAHARQRTHVLSLSLPTHTRGETLLSQSASNACWARTLPQHYQLLTHHLLRHWRGNQAPARRMTEVSSRPTQTHLGTPLRHPYEARPRLAAQDERQTDGCIHVEVAKEQGTGNGFQLRVALANRWHQGCIIYLIGTPCPSTATVSTCTNMRGISMD